MKKTILASLKALSAGVMTLCVASLSFVSCYDDSGLQNSVKKLDDRLTAVEQLTTQLESLKDQIEGLYTLHFKVDADYQLMYTFDGTNYVATGITVDENSGTPAIEQEGDLIKISVGEQSFTLERPEEIVFEIRSGKVYFAESDETKTVNILTSGIEHLTVVSIPRGWYAVINNEGNLEVSSPIEDDPAAHESGYVKVHACGNDGKCFVGQFMVSTAGKLDIFAFGGKAIFDGKGDYYVGVSEIGEVEQDTEAVRKDLEEQGWSEEAGNWSLDGAAKMEVTIAELLGSAPVDGETYVVWGVVASSQEKYTMDDFVQIYYTHREISVEATEDASKKALHDTEVQLSVSGVDSYAVYFIRGAYLSNLENPGDDEYKANAIDQAKNELIGSLEYAEDIYTDNYAGTLSGLLPSYDSDPLVPGSTNAVLVLPIDGRPAEYYTADDVYCFEFTTASYSSGSSLVVSASVLTEGSYTVWGEQNDVNLQTSLVASVSIESTSWSELYYTWLPDVVWAEFENDDQKLVDYLCTASWPTTPEYMEGTFPLYAEYFDVDADPTSHFVAFAVDEDGKYSEVVKLEGVALGINHRQWLLPTSFAEVMELGEARSVLDLGISYKTEDDDYMLVGVSYEDIYGADAEGMWAVGPGMLGTYEIEPLTSTTGTLTMIQMSFSGEIKEVRIPYTDLTTDSCKFDFSNFLGEENSILEATLVTEQINVMVQ